MPSVAPPPAPPAPAAPPPPRRGDALGHGVAALVLAIAGLSLVPVLGSVLAVVFGPLGLSAARDDPSGRGRGLALAGLILGVAGCVTWAGLALWAAAGR
ncbi:MAG: DUF4190 domain-containing protein [Thermoleophilia bacterium]|jgi:hypothetical protein|nr:DUF4190 domain-containing protein [Thermoleophilia bacterium]